MSPDAALPRARRAWAAQGVRQAFPTVSILLARLAGLVLQVLLSTVLARSLGVSAYGDYAVAVAIGTLSTLLLVAGADQLYLAGRISTAVLRRRCTALAGVAFVATLLLAAVWPLDGLQARLVVALIGAGLACELWRQPFLLEPQAALDMNRRASREILTRLLAVLAVCVAALLTHDVLAVGVAAATASVLTSVVVLARLPRAAGAAGGGTEASTRAGLVFAFSGLMYTVYFQADTVLLAGLSSKEEVASYRLAYGLVIAAITVPVALNLEVMRPRLYAHGRRDVGYFAIARRFFVASAALGLAVGVLGYSVGPAVVRLLYGSEYAAAASLLRVLALALPFVYVNAWMGALLQTAGHAWHVLTVQATLAVGNVAANVLVIPAHGAEGAAVVTVCTESAATLLYALLVLTRVQIRRQPAR